MASDLYDFLYREYHPTQGRWIQPDPAGLSAVDATNPQTWNRYGYATENPLALVDPQGLDACFTNFYTTAGGIFGATTTCYVLIPPPPTLQQTAYGPPGQAGQTGGGGNGADSAANNGKSAADIARCAATFSNDHSVAVALQAVTGGVVNKNNLFVNALLGSDASTISNLITGPDRSQTLLSTGISQGTVGVVKVIGNLPNPAATGLASMGAATVSETAAGTAFVSNWTDATIATSLFGKTAGKAFAVFSISKAIWDGSTYLFGAVQCY